MKFGHFLALPLLLLCVFLYGCTDGAGSDLNALVQRYSALEGSAELTAEAFFIDDGQNCARSFIPCDTGREVFVQAQFDSDRNIVTLDAVYPSSDEMSTAIRILCAYSADDAQTVEDILTGADAVRQSEKAEYAVTVTELGTVVTCSVLIR